MQIDGVNLVKRLIIVKDIHLKAPVAVKAKMEQMKKQYLDRFNSVVLQNPTVDKILGAISEKTQVKKEYIAYGIIGLIIAWLAFGWGGELLCNSIGFVYPAYCSIKALESRNKDDDTQWLMYWVVFAVFSVVEFFSDIIMGWVPFYWLTKCAFLVWCMSPLDGASTIYHSIVLPWFRKNQGVLDQAVNDGRKKLSNFADEAINAGTKMALNAGDGKKAD